MIEIGAQLQGRYRTRRILGRGGAAEVIEAYDERLERPVALKVLRADDETDRRRFAGEVRTLAALTHPNLVRVFDAGEHDGDPYLVLEYIDGPSLAAELTRGPVGAVRAEQLAQQLSGALAYIHERGIVHRDVKPSNVLIDARGNARLSDFGIARLVDSTRLTASRAAIGTPAYMAPEQVDGGAVGPPADVYSLGLVLLECLTGARAFPGPPAEAALARLHRDPEIPAGLEPGWRSLLQAMTAREPSARPEAHRIATLLGDADATTVPVAAGATAAMTRPPAPAPRRVSNRLVALVAVAVVGLALLIGVVIAATGGDDSSPSAIEEAPEPTTTAAPTTTLPAAGPTTSPPPTSPPAPAPAPSPDPAAAVSCDELKAQEQQLKEEMKDVQQSLNHDKAARDAAKADLDAQKQAIKEQQRGCVK